MAFWIGAMPRQPRIELPEVPLHVVQRGVNRCAVFIDDDGRYHYLLLLTEKSRTFEVSVHANLGTRYDPLVSPHEVFIGIAPSAQERACAYREWLHASINDEDVQRIRVHLRQEKALGSPKFQAMVEKILGRSVAARPQGRPRRSTC